MIWPLLPPLHGGYRPAKGARPMKLPPLPPPGPGGGSRSPKPVAELLERVLRWR